MVNNVNFVNIRTILDRLMRHPLLTDLSLEAVIQYCTDFIGAMGLPNIYIEKTEDIEIRDYRGMLPCDLISINQARTSGDGICMRSMTDNFNANPINNGRLSGGENTFKTQGRIIYTSFKDGDIQISYKAIPVDEEGFPMIPDNSIFLKALELYIKKEWFTIQFDLGKISSAVLQNTQQSYAFVAGQCNSEFLLPSVSEMESITNILNQMIPGNSEFVRGFRNLGNKEYMKKHRED